MSFTLERKMSEQQKRKWNPILVGFLSSPPNALYIADQLATKILLPSFEYKFNIQLPKAIWMLNIASLLIACTTTIAGRLGYSISHVNTLILGETLYTIGSFLFLIPAFQTHFQWAIVGRIIQNIGLGCCVSQQNPINKQYSKEGKIQKAMMSAGIVLPIFCIIGSIIASSFQDEFQYSYLILGSISLMFIILQLICFPIQFKIINKFQIDFLSVILFCISLCLILYGFMNFAQNKDQLVLSLCLTIGGIIFFIIFIEYDQKVSKNKIFMKGLINKETIKGWFVCFLSQLPYANITTQMSTVLKILYSQNQKTIGRYTAITSLSILIAAILGTIFNQKVLTKIVLQVNFSAWFILLLIDSIQLFTIVNKWVQYICDGFCIFCYGIHLVVTINWLFEFVPIIFDSSLATMNQIISQVGSAFGSTLSVLLVEFISQTKDLSDQKQYAEVYAITDVIFSAICFISIFMCQLIPQFQFEKEKKFYNPKKGQDSTKIFKQVYPWDRIIELL